LTKDNNTIRRVLPWLAVGLFILFIFSNSLWNGEDSGAMSGGLSAWLYRAVEWLKIPISFETFHMVIRKGAHVTEYMILALLTSYASRKTIGDMAKRWIPITLIMVLIPLADEGLQTFVPGRCGVFTDCLIDMGGYAVGLLIAGLAALCRILSWKEK